MPKIGSKEVNMARDNVAGLLIQVINLERRPDRLARISGELKNSGLNFEILVAVDGQEEGYESEYISRGEIGCWKSHVKAMRRQIETGAEFSLILEDDANIGNRIDRQALTQMLELMRRNQLDILQIGFIDQFYVPSLRTGILEYIISLLKSRGNKDASGLRFVLGEFRAGTHAYIVNTRLADAISMTVINPPLIPWDGYLESLARGQLGRGDIRIARLDKSLVSQVSRESRNGKVDSDIASQ